MNVRAPLPTIGSRASTPPARGDGPKGASSTRAVVRADAVALDFERARIDADVARVQVELDALVREVDAAGGAGPEERTTVDRRQAALFRRKDTLRAALADLAGREHAVAERRALLEPAARLEADSARRDGVTAAEAVAAARRTKPSDFFQNTSVSAEDSSAPMTRVQSVTERTPHTLPRVRAPRAGRRAPGLDSASILTRGGGALGARLDARARQLDLHQTTSANKGLLAASRAEAASAARAFGGQGAVGPDEAGGGGERQDGSPARRLLASMPLPTLPGAGAGAGVGPAWRARPDKAGGFASAFRIHASTTEQPFAPAARSAAEPLPAAGGSARAAATVACARMPSEPALARERDRRAGALALSLPLARQRTDGAARERGGAAAAAVAAVAAMADGRRALASSVKLLQRPPPPRRVKLSEPSCVRTSVRSRARSSAASSAAGDGEEYAARAARLRAAAEARTGALARAAKRALGFAMALRRHEQEEAALDAAGERARAEGLASAAARTGDVEPPLPFPRTRSGFIRMHACSPHPKLTHKFSSSALLEVDAGAAARARAHGAKQDAPRETQLESVAGAAQCAQRAPAQGGSGNARVLGGVGGALDAADGEERGRVAAMPPRGFGPEDEQDEQAPSALSHDRHRSGAPSDGGLDEGDGDDGGHSEGTKGGRSRRASRTVDGDGDAPRPRRSSRASDGGGVGGSLLEHEHAQHAHAISLKLEHASRAYGAYGAPRTGGAGVGAGVSPDDAHDAMPARHALPPAPPLT
ncbi:hypothetical protein KFE25_008212 [Diacronema lutheri]|uniref:Uncharacterized protein n=1 Tax=Diacronema lutheri TaxID=2081491 RepID=A0A8J5XGP2_DIALT|nr:hypothetical protein KFE25_008212 [Diacronema lutheri]